MMTVACKRQRLASGTKAGSSCSTAALLGGIDKTQCCMFSLDEAADVGRNDGTSVTEDYAVPFAFNGAIDEVTIAVGEKADAERAASEWRPGREQSTARHRRLSPLIRSASPPP